MIVGVLKEPISGEKRVAATPESVKQLIGKGLKVSIDAISEQVSFEEGTDAGLGDKVTP
jgi:NAD(P) transhydrogenase subunit alpha